jgi:hypothetical protein
MLPANSTPKTLLPSVSPIKCMDWCWWMNNKKFYAIVSSGAIAGQWKQEMLPLKKLVNKDL